MEITRLERMAGSDFAGLSRRIAQAGLLRRRHGYYAARIGVTGALFVACWATFFRLGDSWAQLIVAALLAVVSTHLGFLGHDAGHRQIFRTRGASDISGMLLGNLAIGLGYGWWIDKHSRHHANPNHEEHDPDVGAGALVWTPEQARARRGLREFVARRQAYLFFPMLLLEGLNLHVASVRALWTAPMRRRGLEALLLAAHFAGYLGAVFAVLPVPRALLFVAVHQGLWGVYMGCSFAPNHKGMPMLTERDKLDFLRKQVLTSRNITGGRFVDALLGGLNHQIEHHLFPNMPRPNLRRARPIVREYCRQIGVPYHETGLFDSYRLALGHLHAVGAPGR
jgi:fatty acid desaturase